MQPNATKTKINNVLIYYKHKKSYEQIKVLLIIARAGKRKRKSAKAKKESKPGQKRGPVLDGWKEKQSVNKRKVKAAAAEAAAAEKDREKLKSKSELKQREKMIQKRAGVRDPGRDLMNR